jgi:hypothetical protein
MRHLGRWIPAEKTNTEYRRNICGKILSTDARMIARRNIAKIPVLAEKAIHRTAFVKNCQIVFTTMLVTLTYPIRHTVCRQGIMVVPQQSMSRGAREVYQSSLLDLSQSAKSLLSLANPALVGTVMTGSSLRPPGRFRRKSIRFPRAGMHSL